MCLAQNGYGNYEAACKYIAAITWFWDGDFRCGNFTARYFRSNKLMMCSSASQQLLDTARLQVLAEVFSRAGEPHPVSPNIMDFYGQKSFITRP